jgi:1-deoxy-D-xylulose-5-phosphate synthase
MAPKDAYEFRCMLKTAVNHNGPAAIRYPRASVVDSDEDSEITAIPVGKGEVLIEGQDVLIIAIGSTVLPALEAAAFISDADVSATVINARFVKPLDMDLISGYAHQIKRIITVEENAVSGGFGSAILEALTREGIEGLNIKLMGLPDSFIEQGPQNLLRKKYGLDAEGIAREALEIVNRKAAIPEVIKNNN